MQLLKYIILTFWKELGAIGRIVSFLIVGAPAAMTLAVGFFGGNWSKDQLPWWGWILITILAASVVLLLSIAKKARHLEDEKKSKLHFQGVVEQGGEFSFDFFIRIKNLSKVARISDCICRLEKMVDQAGTQVLPFLPAAFPTMHQKADRQKGRFNLDADQDKLIRICNVITLDNYPVRIANAEDIEHPLPDGRYELTIRAYGAGEPIEETLIIDTRERPILKSSREWGLDIKS